MGRHYLWLRSVHCGVLIVVVTYERGLSRQRQPGAGPALLFAARSGGELSLSRSSGAASFARRDAGGAGLYGDDAAVFRHAPDVLAGDGVGTERGVLVCAGGVVLFVYLRLA